MPHWGAIDLIARYELQQLKVDGRVDADYSRLIEAAGKDKEQLKAVYRRMVNSPKQDSYPFVEPEELADIRAMRPEGPRHLPLGSKAIPDKIRGAILGRCAGCALGMPLETVPFVYGTDERAGWENVKLWFEGADAWPIAGYTPGESRAKETAGLLLCQTPPSIEARAENLRHMPTDDDIRYVILALLLLESKGLDFRTEDVGNLWHAYLTYGQVHSAEGQAYLNYAHTLLYDMGSSAAEKAEMMEWVRTYFNPYREWIGAQIRVDGYAYAAAGRPELAAELAWRDSRFSHTGNGVYGAMFVAAMISAAFVESDVRKIIEIGLSEIPRQSRLAADIRLAVTLATESRDQVEVIRNIHEAFKHYHPVHTNNNAALVAAALAFSGGDFERGISTAVLGGWDTDCNGATVGSILGAIHGAAGLPVKWTAPLHDTLYSEVSGFHPIAISTVADRYYELFKTFAEEAGAAQ